MNVISGRSTDWDFRYAEPGSDYAFSVTRSSANPIIHKDLAGLADRDGAQPAGNNINGPSLIAVPDWIANPLGRYYLYFSHHHGRQIYLAYADSIDGPWTIYPGRVLPLEITPSYNGDPRDHVASPDVHVDHDEQRIRMYYHAQSKPGNESFDQSSYVAVSSDGLMFRPLEEVLGRFYFRVIKLQDYYYAFAKYLGLHQIEWVD